jgi:hypothetical protein
VFGWLPQQVTGTTSTDSPEISNESLKARWQTVMGKMNVMPAMMGWESVRRTMKMEDELVQRDALAHHELLHGDRGSGSLKDNDEMGHMILGDMKTEHHYHGTSKKAGEGLGTLAKLAVGAGLIGSGAGAGLGGVMLIDALRNDPPPIVQPGEIRDWELGQPIVE